MKIMVASDIHGSAYYCEWLIENYKKSEAQRLLLLGDILYHGPRNDLPKDYDPKKVAELLNVYKNDIMCIKGNCDSEVDDMVLSFPVTAEYAVLFDGERMCGELSPAQTQFMNLVRGDYKRGTIAYPLENGETASLLVFPNKRRIGVELGGDAPYARVTLGLNVTVERDPSNNIGKNWENGEREKLKAHLEEALKAVFEECISKCPDCLFHKCVLLFQKPVIRLPLRHKALYYIIKCGRMIGNQNMRIFMQQNILQAAQRIMNQPQRNADRRTPRRTGTPAGSHIPQRYGRQLLSIRHADFPVPLSPFLRNQTSQFLSGCFIEQSISDFFCIMRQGIADNPVLFIHADPIQMKRNNLHLVIFAKPGSCPCVRAGSCTDALSLIGPVAAGNPPAFRLYERNDAFF